MFVVAQPFINITICHMSGIMVKIYLCELWRSLFINWILILVSAFKNYYQSDPVGSRGNGGGRYFPLPQKHSEIKCLLKSSSNWIEVQVCLEQNECSQCTETHSRTESSASPRGRAIALGRPPGKLARWKLWDANSAPENLKNTRPCSPLALLIRESGRLGPI